MYWLGALCCLSAGCILDAAFEGTIKVRNKSDRAVAEVNISKCDADSWGKNRLGQGKTIKSGKTKSFMIREGCYDVRALDGNGVGLVWSDVELDIGAERLLIFGD